jgi:LPS O-antigen subunit length determinant protein (WzzB/FepE family)
MAKHISKRSPEQKKAEAAEGMAAYKAQEAAAHANMLRLRALRLEREATAPVEPIVPQKARAAKKKIIRK